MNQVLLALSMHAHCLSLFLPYLIGFARTVVVGIVVMITFFLFLGLIRSELLSSLFNLYYLITTAQFFVDCDWLSATRYVLRGGFNFPFECTRTFVLVCGQLCAWDLAKREPDGGVRHTTGRYSRCHHRGEDRRVPKGFLSRTFMFDNSFAYIRFCVTWFKRFIKFMRHNRLRLHMC